MKLHINLLMTFLESFILESFIYLSTDSFTHSVFLFIYLLIYTIPDKKVLFNFLYTKIKVKYTLN